MEKLIYKVTKPYIHEGIAAIIIDVLIGLTGYLIFAIFSHEFVIQLYIVIPLVFIFLIFDMPLLIKCLIDRKKQIVIEKTGKYIEMYPDLCITDKFTKLDGSLLTTWYYPKDWNMLRLKPAFRTTEGRNFKPRCVLSYAHDQDSVFMNIIGIQEKTDEPLLFNVKYCKYSKALLSIRMINYPSNMKRSTKDYIDSNLNDLLKWVIKV